MDIQRRHLIQAGLGAATGGLGLAAPSAFAQQTTLRVAAFVPEQSFGVSRVIKPWMAAVEKDIGSKVRLQGFWGGTLGKDPFKQFEAWLAQLSNYAFLAVLTILVAALMLQVISTAAESAVAAGGGIGIANALLVCAAAALTFLIMRQVPSMAQGMASGIALSGFGAVGNVLRLGMGVGRSGLGKMGEFSRGAFLDQDKSRWDSMTRKAGQRLIGARMAREKRPRQNTLKYG